MYSQESSSIINSIGAIGLKKDQNPYNRNVKDYIMLHKNTGPVLMNIQSMKI